MSPSTAIQARIDAFEFIASTSTSNQPSIVSQKYPSRSPDLLEAPISPTASSLSLIAPFSSPTSISRSPSPSPPNLGRKTSLIDLKDWIVDDGPPHTVEHNGCGTRANGTKKNSEYASNKRERANNHTHPKSSPTALLINLETPPIPKVNRGPPLPPRKASYSSLKSLSSFNSTSSSSGASLQPPKSPTSLTIDHTYPPFSNHNASQKTHAPASSVSSFHSVSLSSDGGTTDITHDSNTKQSVARRTDNEGSDEADSTSLGESFENVSSTSVISPTTARSMAKDWEEAMAKRRPPPKLPQRPSSKVPTPASSLPASPRLQPVPTPPKTRPHPTSPSSTATTRRAPPPPPPSSRMLPRSQSSRTSLTSTSASDRSSILSTTTTASRTSISTQFSVQLTNKQSCITAPTPVPVTARKRYEAVFESNALQKRRADKLRPAKMSYAGAKKNRHAVGWRGLSIDLITNPQTVMPPVPVRPEEVQVDEIIGPEDRLEGNIVRMIWSRSNLDRGKLRRIWGECDITSQGALDRDSFVKGMWRIDEELRRAKRFPRQSSGSPSSLSSFRLRQPSKPNTPKLILR